MGFKGECSTAARQATGQPSALPLVAERKAAARKARKRGYGKSGGSTTDAIFGQGQNIVKGGGGKGKGKSWGWGKGQKGGPWGKGLNAVEEEWANGSWG